LKQYYATVLVFIKQHPFLKNILILGSSSGIAQLFPVLTAPLLTRLYSPEEFGVFGLFYSIVTVLSVVAMLRYEGIVIVGQDHKEALFGLITCIGIAFVMVLLVLLICLCIPQQIAQFFQLDHLQYYLLFLSPCLFAMALYYPLGDWFIRNEHFVQQGKVKIILFFALSTIQLLLGVLGFGVKGLILGYILAYSLVDILLLYLLWVNNKDLIVAYRWRAGWEILKKYKKFFYVNLPSGIINNIAVRIPNFFIAPYFGAAALGFFSLGERIINVSLAFISTPISDIFRQRASKEFRENHSCQDTYLHTLKILLYTGVPLLFLFVAFAPLVFEFIFGTPWRETGQYVQVLAFWIIVRYVAAPLSYTFVITNKQEWDIIWQIGLFLISALAFYFGKQWFKTALSTLSVFCLSTFFYYILNILLTYKLANRT
jgi:O-antigen/teichoic acid export membrane protein